MVSLNQERLSQRTLTCDHSWHLQGFAHHEAQLNAAVDALHTMADDMLCNFKGFEYTSKSLFGKETNNEVPSSSSILSLVTVGT